MPPCSPPPQRVSPLPFTTLPHGPRPPLQFPPTVPPFLPTPPPDPRALAPVHAPFPMPEILDAHVASLHLLHVLLALPPLCPAAYAFLGRTSICRRQGRHPSPMGNGDPSCAALPSWPIDPFLPLYGTCSPLGVSHPTPSSHPLRLRRSSISHAVVYTIRYGRPIPPSVVHSAAPHLIRRRREAPGPRLQTHVEVIAVQEVLPLHPPACSFRRPGRWALPLHAVAPNPPPACLYADHPSSPVCVWI